MKGTLKKVTPEGKKQDQQTVKTEDNLGDADMLENGPVQDRNCTDFPCCILFIVANIVFAFIVIESWATGTPSKLFAVYDQSGKSCGIDIQDKPYLYFPVPHPDWLNQTSCVAECPSFKKIEDMPESLDCNTENNKAVDSCKRKCDPLDFLDTSSGWNVTLSTDFSSLFCIYSTDILLDRICFPGSQILSVLPDLQSQIDSVADTQQLSGWFNDITVAWPVIVGSIGVVFWLGVIYMIFVRIFSGIIVWICITGFFLIEALCVLFSYLKYDEIKQARKDCDCELDPNTQQNQDTYLYLFIFLIIIFVITLVGFMCLFNSIRLAIAVIKTATDYVTDTPEAMFVPPAFALVTSLFWIFWLGASVFVYSNGTFTQRQNTIFAQVSHSDEQKIRIWYFIFAGLWNNAFIQSMCQFILASTPSIWYFSQGTGSEAHKPVQRSVYRAFRYHMGSMAFGSLILAIVQVIRLVLEYVYQQSKQAGAGNNQAARCFLNCLRCLMNCFERFIRFLNRNAYIQIALSGRSFCSAAREGMRMVWNNPGRYSLVNGLGQAFIFIGKLFMIIAGVFVAFQVLSNVDPFKTDLTSEFLPCVIIFIISYTIAIIFMSVYGMGIDTILMCFLYDEEQCKGKGAPQHCPETLSDFFQKNQKQESVKKE